MRAIKGLLCVLGLLPLALDTARGQEPPAESFNRTKVAAPFVLNEGVNQPVFEFGDVSDETATPASLKRGIEWNVAEENIVLKRMGSDPADLPGISVGKGDLEIQVKEKDNAPLKEGHLQSGILFKVADAAGLRRNHRAGIYEGTINVRLDPRLTDGATKLLPIKITLVIPGRAIGGIGFVEAKGRTLRVGDASSVRVSVEDFYPENSPEPSLDASLGFLELPWTSDDPTSPKILARRPIPSPKNEKARLARPDEAWAWETEEPILPTRVDSQKGTPIVPGYLHRQTEILVPLPDLVRTGEVRGTLIWGNSKIELPPTKILAGLLRVGRIGFVGENLGLVAIFGEKTPGIAKWGDSLILTITKFGGAAEKVTLQLEPRNGFVRYEGHYEIPSTGKFSVAVDAVSNPAQAAEIPRPIDVWVPLEIRSQFPPTPEGEEEPEPLLIFKSGRPPIHFYQSADSICLLQRGAIDLTLQDKGPMRLRLEGIYKKGSDFRQPISPADPSLIAIDQEKVQSEIKEELSAIEQDNQGWDLTPAATRSIALIAHIHDKTGTPSESRELKVTPLVLRWLIEGVDSNGDPVARFYDQDIRVRVASQMELEFLWVWIVVFLGVIASFAILWFLVISSRGARAPSTGDALPPLEEDLDSQGRTETEIVDDQANPEDHGPETPGPDRSEYGRSGSPAPGLDGSED